MASETALELQGLVIKRVQVTLRKLGFTGSGQTFRYRTGCYELGAHVVKSRDNRRDLARFTLDIYARHPASDTGFWWRRLGELLPWFSDSWW
jgi:hypothetical protein